jgi:hypothetical protein
LRKGLAQGMANPANCMYVLEQLLSEGLLTRQTANAIEGILLESTRRDGRWMSRPEREQRQGAVHE